MDARHSRASFELVYSFVKLLLFAALARKGENRLVRPELPTVTVTFLFTDIEGSTRLIDFLGENGYVEALAEHRRLLRAAFSACGGVEVDTQGDAFLYAFSDPKNAVAAATQGQRGCGSGPGQGAARSARGGVLLTGEGYAGRELHRAARIAASGHGGQVVLSAATGSARRR